MTSTTMRSEELADKVDPALDRVTQVDDAAVRAAMAQVQWGVIATERALKGLADAADRLQQLIFAQQGI